MKILIAIFGFLIPQLILSEEIEFPKDIQKCNYEDNKCIVETINNIFKNKFNGVNGINLPTLDPLHADLLQLKKEKNSPVSVDLQFTNNSLIGFHEAYAIKTKGFSKDLTGSHEIVLGTRAIELVGDYKVDGKVLILPIVGEGKSNLTFVKPVLKITFNGQPLEKMGKIYMKIKNFNLDLQLSQIIYKVDNLFNGDKVLGETMNAFLNENWKDLFYEMKKPVEKSMQKVFKGIIVNVFMSHPYEEFFL